VCLGAMAWRHLAGRDSPFSPARPKIREYNGARLYPMYHPGYVIRGAYDARRYNRDFRRLRRHMDRL
jgi:uracil-DNA glycosylase